MNVLFVLYNKKNEIKTKQLKKTRANFIKYYTNPRAVLFGGVVKFRRHFITRTEGSTHVSLMTCQVKKQKCLTINVILQSECS